MISIITPVYNVEKYLNRCINSILEQTYSNFELLLIDDGSTDLSGTICDRYAAKDSRIKVFHIKNSGCASARNYGLDQAQGDYICFIDSDDYVNKNYLDYLYNALIQTGTDISICSYFDVMDSDYLTRKLPVFVPHPQIIASSDILQNIDTRVEYVVVWNKLFRKSLFGFLRFTTGIVNEDEDIAFRLYLCCKSVSVIESALYYYVYNPASIMHSDSTINRRTSDISHIYFRRAFAFSYSGDSQKSIFYFHKVFSRLIGKYSEMKAKSDVNCQGYIFSRESVMARLKFILKEYNKLEKIPIRMKIYYKTFLMFPNTITTIRNIKHRINHKAK